MTHRSVSSLALAALLGVASQASAQVSAPPGLSVSSVEVGTLVTGMALGPGGPFGTDLYVSTTGQSGGSVLRVDLATGVVTPFATGLSAAGSGPSGLAFDQGTFGTGRLYVVQNGGTVMSVAADGAVDLFSSGGSLYSSNDLLFAPPGSLYGPGLIVSNGVPGSGSLTLVSPDGSGSLLAHGAQFSNAPMGLDLAPPGSAFGDLLHTSVYWTGELLTVTPDGTASPVASGLGWSMDVVFGRAQPFGDRAFVSDPVSQSILSVEPDGTVATWATGLPFGTSGFDADLLFDPSGATLFAATGTSVTVFQSCTDDPTVDLGHGKLGSNGMVPAFSICGGLASGETATARLAFAPPSAPAMLMISLAPNPVPAFGGTVVTVPILFSFVLTTDADGGVTLPVPGGSGPIDVTAQWLMQDVGLPGGKGLSNALTVSFAP